MEVLYKSTDYDEIVRVFLALVDFERIMQSELL